MKNNVRKRGAARAFVGVPCVLGLLALGAALIFAGCRTGDGEDGGATQLPTPRSPRSR
jgi:hypothetical protein